MSANHHKLQRQLHNTVRILSLVLLSFSIFTPTHAADVQPAPEIQNNFAAPVLQKLDKTGEILGLDEQQWSCVKDQKTALMWEKKDPTTALRGLDTFVWHQPLQMITGSARVHPDEAWADSTCYGFNPDDSASFCNTSDYAERINQSNYCGYSDWRLPTAAELLTLVDTKRQQNNESPLLDPRFFPFHDPFLFWTNTVNEAGVVLTIFNDAKIFANSERSDNISVRLVRGIGNNIPE